MRGKVGGRHCIPLAQGFISVSATLLLLAQSVSVAQATGDRTYTIPEIGRALAERSFLALGNGSEKYLVRWQVQTRVALILNGDVPPALLSSLADTVSDIQKYSSHEVTFASARQNFVVVLTHDPAQVTHWKEFAPFFANDKIADSFAAHFVNQKWPCAARLLLTPERAIAAYLLVVALDDRGNLRHGAACITRGLMKGMGVVDVDAQGIAHIRLDGREDHVTYLDGILLRLIYDAGVKTGAPAQAALTQMEAVLSADVKK